MSADPIGTITWPDGLTTIPSGGSFSVSPGQIKALSASGKAWFKATTANAKRAEPRPVPQKGLVEGRQAADRARASTAEGWRPNRYDAHVQAFREEQSDVRWSAVWERVKGAFNRYYDIEHKRRSFLSDHHPVVPSLARNWFAFDEDGKVVLSLTCSRSAALDLALAYNVAGGRLVLLAPEPVLADAATDDCVAIPDTLPAVSKPEAPASDPLIDFAQENGLFYMTPSGRVAIERDWKGEAMQSHALVDPSVTGTPTRATGRPHDTDPKPEMVADWVEGILGTAPVEVGHVGPLTKLKARELQFKSGPVKAYAWTVPSLYGTRADVVVNAELVRCVAGRGPVRIEILPPETGALVPIVRVHRADGLIGLVAGLNPALLQR